MNKKNIFQKINLFILTVFLLSGCSNGKNGLDKENDNFFNLNLTNFNIDITDASEIGILKGSNKRNLSNNTNDTNSNKLVKKVVVYDDNNVIINEENDIEVTFTKIETTTTTEKIEGFKNYTSFGGDEENDNSYIKFEAKEGFNYSIYYNNVPVYDDITDNCQNDLDRDIGIIKLGNLKKNKIYKVKYSGFGVEEVVTTSEVGAEIDKMYVYNNEFTFLSFVPIGESKRFDEEIDQNIYDSKDYYSSNDRQSFIVSNLTGMIYKVNDIHISKIEAGILYLKDNKLPYIPFIDGDNLTFKPLFTNQSINCKYAFRDRYGNTYIYNDKIYMENEQEKVYFFLDHEESSIQNQCYYFLTDNFETIKIEFNNFINNGKIYISKSNNEYEILDNNVNCKIISNYSIRLGIGDVYLYKVNDGKVLYSNYIGSEDLNNEYISYKGFGCIFNNDNPIYRNTIMQFNFDLGTDSYGNFKYLKELDTITFYHNKTLFYMTNIYDNLYEILPDDWEYYDAQGGKPMNLGYYVSKKAYKITEQIDIEINDQTRSARLVRYGLNNNKYYSVELIKEDGELKPLLKEINQNFKPDEFTFIFKPINR